MAQPAPNAADYRHAPVQQIGARHYLNRFSHITVNVTDLERAVGLYESMLGLRRVHRIDGPAQRFAGLGVEEGRFTGWVLTDSSEYPSRALHVVEWTHPRSPGGEGYRAANHVGFYRFEATTRGLGYAESVARAVTRGARPYGPPAYSVLDDKGARGGPVVTVRDPDGISVEVSNEPSPGGVDRLHHVGLNCRDIEASGTFYRDVVGLDQFWNVRPGPQQNNGIIGDELRNPDGTKYSEPMLHRNATLLKCRADDRTPLNLIEWISPEPYGVPYASPLEVGIQSLSFEVHHVFDAYAALSRALHRRLDQLISPPERWDLGAAGVWWVASFLDPDGARLHLVESAAGGR
jgi:catechol 2,3-dioxygenase-like lactoylglutathione lyase family enzyme